MISAIQKAFLGGAGRRAFGSMPVSGGVFRAGSLVRRLGRFGFDQDRRPPSKPPQSAASRFSLLPHVVNIRKGREWFGISYFPGSYGEIAGLLTTLWRDRGGLIVAVWLAVFTIALGIALFQGAFRRNPMLLYLGTSMAVAVAAYLLFIHSLGLRPRPWCF